MMENPLYASLNITQKPSWIHTPSSYSLYTVSSLVFAFKDRDSNFKGNSSIPSNFTSLKHKPNFRNGSNPPKPHPNNPPKPTDQHPQPQSSMANLEEAFTNIVPETQMPLAPTTQPPTSTSTNPPSKPTTRSKGKKKQ